MIRPKYCTVPKAATCADCGYQSGGYDCQGRPVAEALYMTRKEVELYLGIKKQRVYQLAGQKKIRALKGGVYEAHSVEVYADIFVDRRRSRYCQDCINYVPEEDAIKADDGEPTTVGHCDKAGCRVYALRKKCAAPIDLFEPKKDSRP